jgi:uncharacterized membrane protein
VEFLLVLLALFLLAFPICAIWGLVIAVEARRRAAALELRLALAEARLGRIGPEAAAGPVPSAEPSPPAPAWAGTPAVEPPAPTPEEIVAEAAATPVATPPAAPPELPPLALPPTPLPPAPAPAPAPTPDLEESLGTRWAVWVGGVALALGGLFLVRYSIEQGLLGPAARIAAGALFALALIAAGEWMRRREIDSPFAAIPSAHVPGVLTAAGTSTAFATAYAAYALYGMIGPAAAFVVLGAIAVTTMLASALHGPALAALGLVGALASPLLVASAEPKLWPVVLYLVFVVFAAYGLARMRLWRWLALAAAIGALLWTFLLGFGPSVDKLPAIAHILIQTALAGFFLVADPHRRTADEEAEPDWLAGGVLLGFAAFTVLLAASWHVGAARVPFTGAMALMLTALACRYAAAAPAAAAAVLVTLGTLLFWPLARETGAEPQTLFPDVFGASPRPQAIETFLAFAAGLSAAIAAASLWRIARGRALPLETAAWFAGAATAGPLLVLVLAYWRVTAFDRSVSFAVVAALLGAAFALAAGWLRRQEAEDGTEAMDGVRLALGATASAAVAALAAGLTFALDKGMLTVAFALAALGTAWVAERTVVPVLRYVVGALGIAVAGRILYDPLIAGGDLGGTPVFNWLLWGYGVPAVSFFLASRLLERSGRDRVVRFTESLSIVFAALLVYFELRHWLQDGDVFADASDHLEMGLIATASLAFSLVMVRAQARRPDPVYHVASLVFGAITLGVSALGLAILVNPLWSGDEVTGGAVFNSLIPAYLLPAALAGLLYRAARGVRPDWYVRAAGALALALHLLWTVLEIRRAFQGPSIGLFRHTSQGELWTYSIALLLIGVLILVLGFVRDSRSLRLLSGGYIIAAVIKVFLIDLSSLEGVTRALSFIGLGLALVGIGLAYQKLLGRRIVPPPATPPAEPAAPPA